MSITEKKIPEYPCHSRSESIPEIENVSSSSYVRTSVVRELKPFDAKMERPAEGLEVQEFLLNAEQCSSMSENLGVNLKRRFSEEVNQSLVHRKAILTNDEPCTSIEVLNNELSAGTSTSLQMNLKRKFREEGKQDLNSRKRLLKESYPSLDPVITEDLGNFNDGCVDVQKFTYLYKNPSEAVVSEVSLQDRSSEYPPLDPSSLILPASDELLDLQDLQDLPESNLEKNPGTAVLNFSSYIRCP